MSSKPACGRHIRISLRTADFQVVLRRKVRGRSDVFFINKLSSKLRLYTFWEVAETGCFHHNSNNAMLAVGYRLLRMVDILYD